MLLMFSLVDDLLAFLCDDVNNFLCDVDDVVAMLMIVLTVFILSMLDVVCGILC